jgi:hypothetical protein
MYACMQTRSRVMQIGIVMSPQAFMIAECLRFQRHHIVHPIALIRLLMKWPVSTGLPQTKVPPCAYNLVLYSRTVSARRCMDG